MLEKRRKLYEMTESTIAHCDLTKKKCAPPKNVLLRTLCSYSGDQFFTSPSQRGLIHYVNNCITNFGSIINCQHVIPVQIDIHEREL